MWLFSFLGLVWANGQSSHLWITNRAITHLPNGELRDLLEDPSLERHWKNGTMFPDGGYAVGDNYGEIAHWESFQAAYLEWIQDTYSRPWTTEAKQHIAFLMGLGSHGLADQSYDAMYFRRAYVYDAEGSWTESFDTATDVTFVAETMVQDMVEIWVPYEPLLTIFGTQNHEVSESTIDQGQNRLNLAVYWVGSTAAQPDLVVDFREQFPWGTSNQQNLKIPGTPEMESQIVARYWQRLWSQLHSQQVEDALLFTHPADGTGNHTKDHLNIESGLSFGFSVSINAEEVQPEHIQVRRPDGEFHPVVIDVFYGQDSHIINVEPLEDWSEGVHHVTVSQNLPLMDSQTLGDISGRTDVEWSFSTLPVQAPVTEPVKRGCMSIALTHTASVWWMGGLLLCWRRRQCWI